MRTANSGTRAYSYNGTRLTNAGEPVLAVSLDTVKAQLKITTNTDDSLLTLYILAAMDFVEDFTGLTLIETDFITDRDYFPYFESEGYYLDGRLPETFYQQSPLGNVGFLLERTPFLSLETALYVDESSSQVAIDPNIARVILPAEAGKFSLYQLMPGQQWPSDKFPSPSTIIINFKAGFGDNANDVPADLRLAIMQIVTLMYEDRGDCACDCSSYMPPTAKAILMRNRVVRL